MALSRVVLVLLLLLLFAPTVAEENSFWQLKSGETSTDWATFVPSSESLRNQVQLLHATLDSPYESKSQAILGQLYQDVDRFQMLGKKTVQWGGRNATLVSFRGVVEGEDRVARVLVGSSTRGTELLMMVYHPKSSFDAKGEFDKVAAVAPASLPDALTSR